MRRIFKKVAPLSDGSGIVFRDDHFVPEQFAQNVIPWVIKRLQSVVEGKRVVLYGPLPDEDIEDWGGEVHVRCNLHDYGKPTDIRFMKMHRVGQSIYPDFAPLTGITAMNLLLKAKVGELLIAGWDFYLGVPPIGEPKDKVVLHSMRENVEAFSTMLEGNVHTTCSVLHSLEIYRDHYEKENL